MLLERIKNTISLDLSYMIWYNLFADAGVFISNQNNVIIWDEVKPYCFRLSSIDYVFCFFFLTLGNRILFNIKRYPGEFGCRDKSVGGSPTICW